MGDSRGPGEAAFLKNRQRRSEGLVGFLSLVDPEQGWWWVRAAANPLGGGTTR
jgi:hypothetical protein